MLHSGSLWEQFPPIVRYITYSGIRSVTVNGNTTDKNSFLVEQVQAGTPVTLNGGSHRHVYPRRQRLQPRVLQ